MKELINKIILPLFVLIHFMSCEINDFSDVSERPWLQQLINKIESEPVTNPPLSIWRYTYNDKIVYYLPPICCDQFSILYDEYGNNICAPDGGLTGRGDGNCPDFFEQRKNGKLIWKDERTYP